MEIGNILILIGCAIVGIILFRGLWNMMKGGSGNTSQKLMRMRVVAQAAVIGLVVVVVWFTRGG